MKPLSLQRLSWPFSQSGHFALGRQLRPALVALVALVGIPHWAHGELFELGPANQIRVYLRGNSMMQTSPRGLELALRRAVAAKPKAASLLLSEALSVRRSDMPKLAPRLVVAAIRGLGSNPTLPEVLTLVQIGVSLCPEAELLILKYAIAATPKEFSTAIAKLSSKAWELAADSSTQAGHKTGGKEVVPLEGNWLGALKRELKEVVPPESEWSESEEGDPGRTSEQQFSETTLDSLILQEGSPSIPPRPPKPPSEILPPHVPHVASH